MLPLERVKTTLLRQRQEASCGLHQDGAVEDVFQEERRRVKFTRDAVHIKGLYPRDVVVGESQQQCVCDSFGASLRDRTCSFADDGVQCKSWRQIKGLRPRGCGENLGAEVAR